MQTEEQKRKKLVNDQLLLDQLQSKLKIHMIQSNPNPEPDPEPDPEPESEPEPEPEPESNLNPEPEVLNHASDDTESMSSALLLFLHAKIKNTEIHFMINSGTMNNFLSHDLVHLLDLPMNWLNFPIHKMFADSDAQSIQWYHLVYVPFDPHK